MKTIFPLALVSLALGACANLYSYSKEGADSAKTQDDIAACKTVMAPYTGEDAKDVFDKCMAGKGYEKKVEKYRL